MNVLITGANGFIGSSLTEFLLSKDCNVRCLLRPSSRLNWLESIKSDKLSFFRAQGDDVPSLVKALENIDIVICCAGALRANSPQQYYDVNVGNTKKMCEAVLKAGGVKRFIFISSQAAAGPAGGLIPKTLADKANPISDYGKSKLLAEQAVKEMLDKKVDWTILRPSSVYGPRDKDIFIFFNLVSKHLRPKPLKPKFFQLIYAPDIAKACYGCFNNKRSANKIYFLANPQVYSWTQVADIVARAANVKTFTLPLPNFAFRAAAFFAQALAKITGRCAVLNSQKVDELLAPYWIAESAQTFKDLNFEPLNIEIGAKITYTWYKANKWL